MWEQYINKTGWILNLISSDLQLPDFWSLYITSIYFIITTFSSVGYGDVIGITLTECVFNIVVEMLGIIVFGYMIGTF
jgi:hypothetical protein